MANQRYNPRRAKSLRSYTLVEVAELYAVHPQTVRNWRKQGLAPIDGARPALFHGTALNLYHAEQRRVGKQTCGPGELFCFGCRAPRRPALRMADYTPLTAATGTVSAICPVCEGIMCQRVNSTRLARFENEVEVVTRLDEEPLDESP